MKEQMKSAAVMRAGFTMMEIMVAVMIIGILATVGVTTVMKNVETARLSAAADGVKTLKEAVVSYNMKYGKMPNDLKDLLKETDDETRFLKAAKMRYWIRGGGRIRLNGRVARRSALRLFQVVRM